MAWLFCTSGAAILKAGTNRNTVISASGSTLAGWSDEAESLCSDSSRIDLSGSYSTLTNAGKFILSNITSSLIAQKIIHYDMSGYTSRGEATLMLNVLENDIRRGLDLIKESNVKAYLGAD